MPLFSVTSLVLRCNLCYVETIYKHIPVSYNTICYLYILLKQDVLKGKVYIYAFHLRKGEVIEVTL